MNVTWVWCTDSFCQKTLLSHSFGHLLYMFYLKSVNYKKVLYFEQNCQIVFTKIYGYRYLNLPVHQADGNLNYIWYDKRKKALSRLASHRLQIEYTRYDKKRPINERKCIYSNSNDVKNDCHLVLVCDFYTDLRKLYIKKLIYLNLTLYWKKLVNMC